jgi:hypothetical protein
MCVGSRVVVSDTCCVVFFIVLSALCFRFLWIVHFWLTLRCSLTFFFNNNCMIQKHYISKLLRYLWVIQHKIILTTTSVNDLSVITVPLKYLLEWVQKWNWPNFCNYLSFHTSLSEIANFYWTMCNSVIIRQKVWPVL